MMATTSVAALPSLLCRGRTTLLRNHRKNPVSGFTGYRHFLDRKRCGVIVAKAVSDSSDSSSESIVKYVLNAWDKSEDRIAVAGLGFASIAVFWASINLIVAIDKLPLIPNVFEVIGILFSWWFVYRYLLFKPDREELSKNIKNSLSDIIGQ